VGVVAVVIVAVLAIVLASLIAFLLGRRAGADPLRRKLESAESSVRDLTVSVARLEAHLEAAGSEADRLRRIEAQLKASLAAAEQERTRSDDELRQTGLAASRVPELEQQLTAMGSLRAELAAARARIAELAPVAEELELRNQFIESLQRELSYRDERGLSLERRVDQLGSVVEAIESARASLASGASARRLAEREQDRRTGPAHDRNADAVDRQSATSGRAAARREDDSASVHDTESVGDPGAEGSGGADGADGGDEDGDRPPASIGRALEQALHGLGVRSFADLGIFDHNESASDHD
jgi:chromosome segregation ATPase